MEKGTIIIFSYVFNFKHDGSVILEMSNVITDKTSQEVQGPMSNLKCLSFSFEPLEDGK